MLNGWIGEKKTAFRLWLWLNSKKYHKCHNLILPSTNGTTQIDHLIVSQFGVFIVETKNKKGWIFGSENQASWTQVLFEKKYQFQNPLRQTYRQKKVLAEFLDLDESLICPIVYFGGRCRFKTPLPTNVMKSGLTRYIKRFKSQVIPDYQLALIKSTIDNHISNSSITKSDHLYSLKRRHESVTHCPKCGSKLVVRTVTKGERAGTQFWGCEAYPKCRYTKNL